MSTEYSQKFLRQRKFLLVVPLLVFPFLALIFWALGGGENETKQAAAPQQKGFNLSLPKPHFNDDKGVDKMAYYNQAAADSAKNRDRIKNESIFGLPMAPKDSSVTPAPRYASAGGYKAYTDPNEAKVYHKLDELNAAINGAMPAAVTRNGGDQPTTTGIPPKDIERLEKMMQTMQSNDENNPEIRQLSEVLDKLLKVQHPELLLDSLKKESDRGKAAAFPVDAAKATDGEALLLSPDSVSPGVGVNRFYGLDGRETTQASRENTVEAILPETQTLVDGANVKLQLLSEILVNGTTIHRNSFVYGTAQLSNERLLIGIRSVRAGKSVIPVKLEVYDEDGVAGLFMPGAIGRDVLKQSADQSLGSVGMLPMDPSLTGQATSAGIEMARTLMSKKIRLVRVTVKAGYHVWLKDSSQQ